MPRYCIEFFHKGKMRGLTIHAEDEDDLRDVLRKLPYARVVGTHEISIPTTPSTAPLMAPLLSLVLWARNIIASRRS